MKLFTPRKPAATPETVMIPAGPAWDDWASLDSNIVWAPYVPAVHTVDVW